jgi:hypothetical protein
MINFIIYFFHSLIFQFFFILLRIILIVFFMSASYFNSSLILVIFFVLRFNYFCSCIFNKTLYFITSAINLIKQKSVVQIQFASSVPSINDLRIFVVDFLQLFNFFLLLFNIWILIPSKKYRSSEFSSIFCL